MKIILIAILSILGLSSTLSAQQSSFDRIVIDSTVQFNSHKPKVFARFSNDPYNDLGSLDNDGFKLYRYSGEFREKLLEDIKVLLGNRDPQQGNY